MLLIVASVTGATEGGGNTNAGGGNDTTGEEGSNANAGGGNDTTGQEGSNAVIHSCSMNVLLMMLLLFCLSVAW